LIRSRVERFQARSLGTSLFGPAAAVARAASQAQKIGELHRFTATDVSFMGAHRTPPSSSGFAVRAAQIMSCYRPRASHLLVLLLCNLTTSVATVENLARRLALIVPAAAGSPQPARPRNRNTSRMMKKGRTQETEFYARQALIALENDACQ